MARARWESSFFSAAPISANVLPSTSKTGSYPNPPSPRGSMLIKPSTAPSARISTPSGNTRATTVRNRADRLDSPSNSDRSFSTFDRYVAFWPEYLAVRREPVLGVGLEQQILAEQLVEPVLVLVGAPLVGMLLGDGQDCAGGVDHRGAGEDVVADPVAEDVDHHLDVSGVVRGDVLHAVPVTAADGLAQGLVVRAVGDETPHAIREHRIASAPVADGHVVAGADQLVHQGPAVELRAPHHQHLHLARAPSRPQLVSGDGVAPDPGPTLAPRRAREGFPPRPDPM